jgi:hypothetical protein
MEDTMNFLYFVYAYSMSLDDYYESLGSPVWPQRFAHAVVSYHHDARHANACVSNLINSECFSDKDKDICWGVGSIPLCHDEFNL